MTFLSATQVDDQVQAMYDGDVAQMGFVMNLSAVWAHLPDAHERIFDQLGAAAAAAGLSFVGSWVSADVGRCFQLMECDDVTLFQRWVAAWSHLIEFEIVPVVPGKDTAAALPP